MYLYKHRFKFSLGNISGAYFIEIHGNATFK